MTPEESVQSAVRRYSIARLGNPLVAWMLVPLAVLGVGLATGLSAHGGPPTGPYPDAAPPESRPSVTLIGQTPEQENLVYEVVDRFASAGLDLPPLTLTFWPSRDECDGMGGWHRDVGEIEVCIPSPRMIAHEIAHAWDAHNLTDSDREAYRRLWDAPTWASHEFEWQQRAMELAANTVAFAVLNDDSEPYQQILMYLCTYEALTHRPLPTPVNGTCPPARLPGQAGE